VRLAALLASLLAVPASGAETLSFVVADRAMGVSEGLPAAQVLALHEDRSGAVWAGTTAGLARLGGAEIRVFGLADGLPRNVVYQVAEAPDGTLIVGTLGGLARFDGRSFRREAGEAGGDRRVRSLVAGPGGELYALLGRDLILRLRGDTWQTLGLPRESALDVLSLAAGSDGDIWLATRTQGLQRFAQQGSALIFKERYGAAQGLPGDEAYFVIADADGVAATGRDGVLLLHGGRARRVAFPAGFGEGHRVLTRSPAGRLYVGAQSGVAELEGGRLRRLLSSRGLAEAAVVALTTDRSGNLWVGTVDRGIHLLFTGNGVSFVRIGGQDLRGVDCDEERFCWMGGDAGLYRVRLDEAGAPVVAQSVRAEGMAAGPLFAFETDGAGGILVGTEDGVGLLSADSRTGPDPVLRRDPRFAPCGSGFTPRIVRDKGGTIWVASLRGLFRVEPGARLAVPVALPSPGRDPAWAMILDREDALWLADHAGSLWRLPAPGRAAERVAIAGTTRQPVEQLAPSPAGDVLVSFEDGSWMLIDAATRRPSARMPAGGELEKLAVFSVARLPDGRELAAHGGSRLSLVTLQPPRIVAPLLSSADLDDADLRYLTVHPAPGGALWLSTLGSVARLQEVGAPPAPKPLTVWSLRTENPQEGSTAAAPLLAARPNAVDVVLSLAEPVAPRLVRYRWRLRGESDKWSPWTSDPHVRVSNLGDGEFSLEAEARDRYGRSAPASLAIPIRAAPLLFETWPFRSVLALSAGLILYGAYRVRVRQMVREHERLEAAVAERSAELAQANRELREASLTDVLTGLRNRRYFDAAIADEESRARRAHSPRPGEPRSASPDLVLYIVDLDHFKEVNDTWGHATGDRVLVETARRLSRVVRHSDLLIRWGGEEFLVVSRDARRAEGEHLARRILDAVGGTPFDVGEGQETRRTCSVGWAPFPWIPEQAGGEDHRPVLRLADRALYQAKREGRNRAIGFLSKEDGEPRVIVADGAR
jgi:diguanylate cyclase (GGDEF)-like protein